MDWIWLNSPDAEWFFSPAANNEKICYCRNDFEQKLSTEIIKNHDVIRIEDLNVKRMIKNHRLVKPVSDASWS